MALSLFFLSPVAGPPPSDSVLSRVGNNFIMALLFLSGRRKGSLEYGQHDVKVGTGSVMKSGVNDPKPEGDQPQSAAATVEGLACPKCSSREPEAVGGEDV